MSCLFWLPPTPDNFKERLKDLAGTPPNARAKALIGAALYDHSEQNLRRLGKAAAGLGTIPGFATGKLHVISNSTTDYILPVLHATALRYGCDVTVSAEPFGVVEMALAAPSDDLVQADSILIALDHRYFGFSGGQVRYDADTLAAAQRTFDGLVDGLSGVGTATVLIQTIPTPLGARFGSIDTVTPGSAAWFFDTLNRHVRDLAGRAGLALVDVATVAAEVGTRSWFDQRAYALAKQPFDAAFLPLYGDRVARVLAALKGRSRKVLILDLDNTLWGGVVGDDGVESLRLGPDTAEGEAHLNVQRAAVSLRARGIVLAVCSKNDDDVARHAIRSHPHMALREEDFAVIKASWNDKASAIEEICASLNLGLDAAVFLDDNPAERAFVRERLPEVAVLNAPEDATEYADLIACCGFFETVSITDEDRNRADMYQADMHRTTARNHAGSLDDFLTNLEMTLSIETVADARFAQLVNKTNQFNLTLKRYGEGELAALADDPGGLIFGGHLSDKFGDQGKITAIIGRIEGELAFIDCWSMSCRVLQRGVEKAVLNVLAERALAAGARTLVGTYVEGPRNAMVRDHYKGLGFVEGDNGSWSLDLNSFTPFATMIAIR